MAILAPAIPVVGAAATFMSAAAVYANSQSTPQQKEEALRTCVDTFKSILDPTKLKAAYTQFNSAMRLTPLFLRFILNQTSIWGAVRGTSSLLEVEGKLNPSPAEIAKALDGILRETEKGAKKPGGEGPSKVPWTAMIGTVILIFELATKFISSESAIAMENNAQLPKPVVELGYISSLKEKGCFDRPGRECNDIEKQRTGATGGTRRLIRPKAVTTPTTSSVQRRPIIINSQNPDLNTSESNAEASRDGRLAHEILDRARERSRLWRLNEGHRPHWGQTHGTCGLISSLVAILKCNNGAPLLLDHVKRISDDKFRVELTGLQAVEEVTTEDIRKYSIAGKLQDPTTNGMPIAEVALETAYNIHVLKHSLRRSEQPYYYHDPVTKQNLKIVIEAVPAEVMVYDLFGIRSRVIEVASYRREPFDIDYGDNPIDERLHDQSEALEELVRVEIIARTTRQPINAVLETRSDIDPKTTSLISRHYYAVENVDLVNQTVSLINPRNTSKVLTYPLSEVTYNTRSIVNFKLRSRDIH